jgi:hypothetical protein
LARHTSRHRHETKGSIVAAPEPNSSRPTSFKSTCFDRPANNVGPWPASLGCTMNSYRCRTGARPPCGTRPPPLGREGQPSGETLAQFAEFAETGVARQCANSANNAMSHRTEGSIYQAVGLTFSLLAAYPAAHVRAKATGSSEPAYRTCHEWTSALDPAGASSRRTLQATGASMRGFGHSRQPELLSRAQHKQYRRRSATPFVS